MFSEVNSYKIKNKTFWCTECDWQMGIFMIQKLCPRVFGVLFSEVKIGFSCFCKYCDALQVSQRGSCTWERRESTVCRIMKYWADGLFCRFKLFSQNNAHGCYVFNLTLTGHWGPLKILRLLIQIWFLYSIQADSFFLRHFNWGRISADVRRHWGRFHFSQPASVRLPEWKIVLSCRRNRLTLKRKDRKISIIFLD